MSNPNFTNGVGRLVADKYDFQKHVDGYSFRHKANQIDLSATITINGTPCSNTQTAITALSTAISPPVIADATLSTKGIIKLAGDLSGTANSVTVSALRGKPISTLAPNTNDVLKWDGYSWTPGVSSNAFVAAGDLGGTNTLQQVNGLTGTASSSGTLITINNGASFAFHQNSANSLITQYNSTSLDGKDLTIRAQSTIANAKNGGNVLIAGGKNGSSGLKGAVRLQLTTSVPNDYPNSIGSIAANMLEVTEVSLNRRIISLFNATNTTATEMPANTGDFVLFIKDALTPPTTGSPVGGSILYSDSGALWVKQADSNQFQVGTIANPSVWGSSTDKKITARVTGVSTDTPISLYSYGIPLHTSVFIEVTFVGKADGQLQAFHAKVNASYIRGSGSAEALTNPDSKNTSLFRMTEDVALWDGPGPDISLSGNNIIVYSGAFIDTLPITMNWIAIVELTIITD